MGGRAGQDSVSWCHCASETRQGGRSVHTLIVDLRSSGGYFEAFGRVAGRARGMCRPLSCCSHVSATLMCILHFFLFTCLFAARARLRPGEAPQSLENAQGRLRRISREEVQASPALLSPRPVQNFVDIPHQRLFLPSLIFPCPTIACRPPHCRVSRPMEGHQTRSHGFVSIKYHSKCSDPMQRTAAGLLSPWYCMISQLKSRRELLGK